MEEVVQIYLHILTFTFMIALHVNMQTAR